ncbi:hypothetical protein NP493_198g00007 [Ridgeia piscesae]|uniref:Integral membrane protein GPR137B n=1 Tax=Ridgeia piscesae TaxID=27915 RepID=A0AAD9UEH7_RIDPI|nr:hypothetical protein NP493_198g00007 [Ridgeia piscesae]
MAENHGTATDIPLTPAISPSVHLSLTIVYTVLYGTLFFIVYVQLWMILYYRHRHFSYESVFLFLCLFWAGLRTTLFSFYFKNCVLVNNLNTFSYWLFYCCPICLQFVTLCLLVVFFAQVVFKSTTIPKAERYRKILSLCIAVAITLFVVTNVTCAVIIRSSLGDVLGVFQAVSLGRVAINDTLFIVFGVALAAYIYKMSKMSTSEVVLEARGMTVRRAVVTSVLIVLLYTSRAVYNFIAISGPLRHMLSFGYGWVNVSDQLDFVTEDQGLAYVSFGIVLFAWEFLPTFVVVMFFRVSKPPSTMQLLPDIVSSGYQSRTYFFDNPRRYDSDDDLSRSFPSVNSVVHSSSLSPCVSYGEYDRNVGINNPAIPGTPPALRVANPDLYPSPATRHHY